MTMGMSNVKTHNSNHVKQNHRWIETGKEPESEGWNYYIYALKYILTKKLFWAKINTKMWLPNKNHPSEF